MDLLQFFPEANEVTFARQSAFEGSSLKLDYLTKPSFFEDFGFVEKVKMTDRVKPEDELFLVAYPYFNVNEMLVVEELYKEAIVETVRKLIIFNGELDRIRCYPGPWKVLRKVRNAYICLHQQEAMPSLKEVALDILPSHPGGAGQERIREKPEEDQSLISSIDNQLSKRIA
ncbi:unnamed protein product [Dovyalis caffra]|uniref:DUF1995 domain-containing protein n=1 Tax=Dovyalis caffra TaxID=77055 RepID=A0AAV1STC3_9ROSI|nr:unnamed protein product [Dovyalis caffra]